jgi:hypothetical protein
MRYAPRAILAGGLGFAASFVVACGGGSGLLSADQSNALSSQVDQINSAVQAGNCGAAVNASSVLGGDVQTLPVTINPTLRRNLSQGASTIAQLAARECHQHTASTASIPTSTSSTSTTTTSTTTSTSTSTPTTTTSTSTTSTSATTPTETGTTSTTTGGVGLGGGTTTTTTTGGNGTGGTGAGSGTSSGSGGGG